MSNILFEPAPLETIEVDDVPEHASPPSPVIQPQPTKDAHADTGPETAAAAAAAGQTSGYAQAHVLMGHTRAVASVKYSPDGSLLASACKFLPQLWSVHALLDPKLEVKGSVDPSYAADATLRLWRSNGSGGDAALVLKGHDQGLSDASWSSDGQVLASASDDMTAKLWDAETGDELLTLEGHSSYVFCANFNPQGTLLATGSFDENVKLWDVRNGKCLRTLLAHSDPVTSASFSRDGTVVVTGSHDGLVRLWDVGTGECLKTFFAEGNPPVSFVKFSPNSRYLLVGTLDDTLRLWSAGHHSRVAKVFKGHANRQFCLASALGLAGAPGDPQVVASGSEDGSVNLWDLQAGSPTQRLSGHKDAVLGVDFHPTERGQLASCGSTLDKTVRLWQLQQHSAA